MHHEDRPTFLHNIMHILVHHLHNIHNHQQHMLITNPCLNNYILLLDHPISMEGYHHLHNNPFRDKVHYHSSTMHSSLHPYIMHTQPHHHMHHLLCKCHMWEQQQQDTHPPRIHNRIHTILRRGGAHPSNQQVMHHPTITLFQ